MFLVKRLLDPETFGSFAEFYLGLYYLRGIDTLGIFSAIFHKGDNFCDHLLAFLHAKSVCKGFFFKTEEFCSQMEQII